MKKLTDQSDANSPASYDAIFKERQAKGLDWSDLRRWKCLLKYYKGGNILDAGCLDSQISQLIKGQVGAYIGIDLASEAIGEMQKRYGGGNVQFEVGDACKLDFEDNIFDYAIAGELLEHLVKPEEVVEEIVRILKPGGVLAASVPLCERPGDVDQDRHIWSFTKQGFAGLFTNYGKVKMKILRSRGIPYLPGYKYCHRQLICWLFKK